MTDNYPYHNATYLDQIHEVSDIVLPHNSKKHFSSERLMINMPKAKKVPHIVKYHKDELVDYYHWLRDPSWNIENTPTNCSNEPVEHKEEQLPVTSPEILRNLEQENIYYHAVMSSLKSQEDAIHEQLMSRIKLEDTSVPIKKDNYYYYIRTEKDSDHHIICRKKDSLLNREEILLDANALARNHKFFHLGDYSISSDHNLLAYSTDKCKGGERYTIQVKDLSKNSLLPDIIENSSGDIVWHESGKGFFYAKLSNNWRSEEIYYHELGTSADQDKLILKENDHIYQLSINKSSSRQYIFITATSKNSNETWYIDFKDKNMSLKPITPRKEDHLYYVDHLGDQFYIRTNDLGKNFRLVKAPASTPSQENWLEVVPHNNTSYLTNFYLYDKHIVLESKEAGLKKIKIMDLASKQDLLIDFPDSTYSASVIYTSHDAPAVRFAYSSLNTPNSTIERDFANNRQNVLKVQEIPSGFNPNLYASERIYATAEDGTKIPISLVYKKELFKGDGSNPLYLYGYGSYGISIPASFKTSIITLLDKGFVYAIAHIRGGDDLGYEWYENGKFLNKKNTFTDFIASAETLISEKYTSEGNIVIAGGSAGGMLMGVTINLKPSLFKACVMHVPFVDVLNTMMDESLPLTPGEYKEWGNPQDLTYYNYIKSYSPYENIKQQNYPHIYVTAGLYDNRVTYWEPAKWVAKMRATKTDKNYLLFETNMDSGHQGTSGRLSHLRDTAKEYNFIFKIFGIKRVVD